MKKMLLLSFFIVAFFSLSIAQSLQYTRWKKYDIYFRDTLTINFRAGEYVATTNAGFVLNGLYTENGDIITQQDVAGPNACLPVQIGTYKFSILNNIVHFDLVSDPCTQRANSMGASDWKRVPCAIIRVPADYPTIQLGINAAKPGDTVLVAEGTYYEQINFKGKKPLVVASRYVMHKRRKDNDTAN